MRSSPKIFLAALAIASISVLTQESALAVDAVAHCAALKDADFTTIQDAPTQIVASRAVRAAKDIPGYCRVEGRITPQLDIEVRLPASRWNGKLLALANAREGEVCDAYLKRGYACMPMFRTFKKDQRDEDWAAVLRSDLKARLDMNRGPHLLALAAKAIVARYYAKAAQKSYFMGCSAGGHSAMVEAQIFPWDYDGIVAGAPNLDTADWLMRAAWSVKNSSDDQGQSLLSADDLQILHRGVLGACDRDDGVEDGIVTNPLGCGFDPATLLCTAVTHAGCLTSTQVDAIARLYKGPAHAIRNFLPGSELGWSAGNRDAAMRYLTPFFRLIFDGTSPELIATNVDFERDHTRMGLGASVSTPNHPDLRKFKSAGGKLIAYLGTHDTAHVTGIIDYYETVERTMGGRAAAQDFFRFFLVPGMEHCTGGVGAYAIDYLSYLEAWVEQGRAPHALIGAHVNDSYLASIAASNLEFPLDPGIPVDFTRPIYPYPLYAKHKGTGDPKDAANFDSVDPQIATSLRGIQ